MEEINYWLQCELTVLNLTARSELLNRNIYETLDKKISEYAAAKVRCDSESAGQILQYINWFVDNSNNVELIYALNLQERDEIHKAIAEKIGHVERREVSDFYKEVKPHIHIEHTSPSIRELEMRVKEERNPNDTLNKAMKNMCGYEPEDFRPVIAHDGQVIKPLIKKFIYDWINAMEKE